MGGLPIKKLAVCYVAFVFAIAIAWCDRTLSMKRGQQHRYIVNNSRQISTSKLFGAAIPFQAFTVFIITSAVGIHQTLLRIKVIQSKLLFGGFIPLSLCALGVR